MLIIPTHFIYKKFHCGCSFSACKKYYTVNNRLKCGSKYIEYAFVYTQPDGAPNWDHSSRAPGPVGLASIIFDKDSCHLCVWEDAMHQTLTVLPTDFSAGAQLCGCELMWKGG